MLRARKSSELEMSCPEATKASPSLFVQETCPHLSEWRGRDCATCRPSMGLRSSLAVPVPLLILAVWCQESLGQEIVEDLRFLGRSISLTATSVPLHQFSWVIWKWDPKALNLGISRQKKWKPKDMTVWRPYLYLAKITWKNRTHQLQFPFWEEKISGPNRA